MREHLFPSTNKTRLRLGMYSVRLRR